ncbi:MAG: hypothetical protein Q6361_06560 [Candidatus Hermodarchaeota archaeon]|jgi:hypothetical protein|nr:hypothetical protein [Candidatus Hermodarchaeota archaeon]
MPPRKYMALIPIVLGLLIFGFFTTRVIATWLTLPPFSIDVEGQYVSFSLLLLMYAYALPITSSLCLGGYLVYPPMFHQLHTLINLLAAFFMVLGIAALVILPVYALVRGISIVIAMIAFMAPYIIVPILAYKVYVKSRYTPKIGELEPHKSDTRGSQSGGVLSLIGGALMVSSQIWSVPFLLIQVIMLPSHPVAMQPSMIQSIFFMAFYAAIPIAIGFMVVIAGYVTYSGDKKTGGLLAIAFAVQSFSTFGLSLVLGAILALSGGALAYFSKDSEYEA